MDGVKTKTFGVVGLSDGEIRDVSSGRKDWIVKIGCSRWVLNRSANDDGGIVAIGEVW